MLFDGITIESFCQSKFCENPVLAGERVHCPKKNKPMKKEIIQAVVSVAVAGMLIYLIRKIIMENNKRIAEKKKENEFISIQRGKFKDAYGEYTL